MHLVKFLVYEFGVGLFSLTISILFIALGNKLNKVFAKQIAYSLFAIFITLFLFELQAKLFSDHPYPNKLEGSFIENPAYTGKKEHLGYGPKEDTSFIVSAKESNSNTVIYDVNYSICNGKRRVVDNDSTNNQTIYFAGCSHTFGHGLNDDQTLPSIFNRETKQKYNVINIGFNGYGSHQVYNQTIHTKFNDKPNTIFIYKFISDHINRAAGMAPWDKYGPLFEVENNKLVLKGSFEEHRIIKSGYLGKRLKSIFKKSHFYKSIIYSNYSKKNINRCIYLINGMQNSLSEKNIRFILLLHIPKDQQHKLKSFYENLDAKKIEYYDIEDITEIDLQSTKYYIKEDKHPNELFNTLLANGIISIISQ